MAPTLRTDVSSLPPEGAAAPADWQSQIRGPCLKELLPPRSLTAFSSLHLAGRRSPETSLLLPVRTCAGRFGAAGTSPEGAAAPAGRQSRTRGPCLKGSAHRAAEGFPVRGLLTNHEKLVS